MNTSAKEDIRRLITGASVAMALFMMVLTLGVALTDGGPISVSESLILGALTGVPLAVAFYLSIGRESVGGLPVALVVAVGFSAADAVCLLFGCGWGLLVMILSSVLCIAVQLICNKISESSRL